MYVDPSGNSADYCPVAKKKYMEGGFSEEEATLKAIYDKAKETQGERKAKEQLDQQLRKLRESGYEFSDKWNSNNILNKPISEWTNADLQRAIDSILQWQLQ